MTSLMIVVMMVMMVMDLVRLMFMTSSLNESTSPLTCDQLDFVLMIIMIMVMLMLELKTITMFPTTNIIFRAEPEGDGCPREKRSY